jgi:hypothetical protein
MTGEVLFSENNYYLIPAEKGQNKRRQTWNGSVAINV